MDRIDAAVKASQGPKGKPVPGLKFETRLPSGAPVVVLIPLSATDADVLALVGSLARELPPALAKQRGPVSRIVLPARA